MASITLSSEEWRAVLVAVATHVKEPRPCVLTAAVILLKMVFPGGRYLAQDRVKVRLDVEEWQSLLALMEHSVATSAVPLFTSSDPDQLAEARVAIRDTLRAVADERAAWRDGRDAWSHDCDASGCADRLKIVLAY